MSDFDWSGYMGEATEGPPLFAFENVGDEIVGLVSEIVVAKTKYGERPKLTIDTDAGQFVVIVGGAGLTPAVAEKNPQVGCKIAIKFTSEKDVGKGNPLKLYEVKVAHPKAALAQGESVPAGHRAPEVDGAGLGEFFEEPF